MKVEARAFEVQAGDRLLLCSDGLTEMVTSEMMIAALDEDTAPENAARALVAQANGQGGRDNITIVIARFDAAAPG